MYSYPPQKYKDVLQINDDNLQKNRQRYPNVHNHIKKYSVSLGKIEIKPRIRYHYTSTRRLQLKTVTIPNAREDLEQLRFSYTAHENKNWHNHFAKLIGYMYKLDYQHSLCLSNSTSRYIPNRNSILKDMYKNVHSSIICNSPQMGTTQMSATIEYISRW